MRRDRKECYDRDGNGSKKMLEKGIIGTEKEGGGIDSNGDGSGMGGIGGMGAMGRKEMGRKEMGREQR